MKKCLCREILKRESGIWHERLAVHLMGCPEDSYTKEYQTYNWWQKLFNRSPESIYSEHFKF